MPTSLKTAFDESIKYAREAHNRSVEQVAELMGKDNWWLYKVIAENRMPSGLIRVFEHACGIDLPTRYMAASTGKLIISVAVGRTASVENMATLQADTAEAIKSLLHFYAGQQSAAETQAAIQTAMQQLGWHHANVAKHDQPELEFNNCDD